MAVRFRKSVKLAPGIRMNFSGSGMSWTLGPRGASVGIGKRGTYLNTGIPGTGLYSRQLINGGARAPRQRPTTPKVSMELTVSVSDDGTITFKDSSGNPVPETIINMAKKQKGDVIKATIQKKCDEINAQVEALGELHYDTPNPTIKPYYEPQAFEVPKPILPILKIPGFFARLFKSWVAKIEAENIKAQANFDKGLRDWEANKALHDAKEHGKHELIAKAVSGDATAMETFFGEVLMDVVWPRETLVSFEVMDEGKRLVFDVDLPEVEDMPIKTASVPQRGYKLTVKDIGVTNIQKLYARHIHSIGFRLIGEVFGMLPTVEEVTLSGYSQRKNKTTGQETNEYLFSVVVPRDKWQEIDFSSLKAIDTVEVFTRFDFRREMTKSGLFKPVEPF